jgi:predicted ATPase/DNA-binding SARP family transcriptional activator
LSATLETATLCQMSELTLAFLNQFAVQLNGRFLHRFESDNARALLVYLVLEAQQAHRRSHLAALFWPDHADKEARNNLRQTLFKLRRTLKDEQRDPPFLQITNQTVQWCADVDVDVDVWQLTAVLNQFTSEKTIEPDTLLSLYAGPLLAEAGLDAGLGFEEWLLVKREQLHRQVMGALAALTANTLAQRDWQTAVKISSRQVALDPWREEAYQQLMQALVGQGQRTAALAIFEQCRELLWQELGVTPMPQTVTLYEQIKVSDLVQTRDDDGETAVSSQPTALNHNLPTDLTPFIGREAILEKAAVHLANSDCRLLTLNGLGGIGKTRLSLQLARQMLGQYADGVWVVPLAGLPADCTDEQLETAVVSALPMMPGGALPLRQQLTNFLRQRHLLLILDNFEHILSSATRITHLLAAAPQVQCVVTSRQPLAVAGEWVLNVPPLSYPQASVELDEEASARFEAVRLFFQHARMRRADFSLSVVAEPFVIRICQLVEGHPLALELAASWVDTLSCHEIAQEIATSLALLRDDSGQRPLRHASIEQIMQHSWARLTADERVILNKMALFTGGCTREAAQQVTGATLPLLKSLINRSLLRLEVNHQQAARYVLHELVRHFALTMLANEGELENGRFQHAHYYLPFLAAQEANLMTAHMVAAMEKIQPEMDNIERAWQWAIDQKQCALLAQTAPALTGFLQNNGRFAIGQQLLKFALTACPETPQLKNRLAAMLNMLGVEAVLSIQLTTEAFMQATAVHDEREAAYACLTHGATLRRSSHFTAAWDMLETGLSLLSANDDPWLTAALATQLCTLIPMLDRYDDAPKYGQIALQASAKSGQPPICFVANYALSQIAMRQSDMRMAEQYTEAGLAALGDYAFPYQRAMLQQLQGFIVYYRADLDNALRLFIQAHESNSHVGDLTLTATTQGMVAHIALKQSRYAAAIAHAEEAIAAANLTNDRWRKGQVLITLGLASFYAGNQAKAASCMGEVLLLADELAEPGLRTICLIAFVEWLALLGERPLAAETAATVQTHFTLTEAWQAEVDVLCERFELEVETAVAPTWPLLYEKLENFMALTTSRP